MITDSAPRINSPKAKAVAASLKQMNQRLAEEKATPRKARQETPPRRSEVQITSTAEPAAISPPERKRNPQIQASSGSGLDNQHQPNVEDDWQAHNNDSDNEEDDFQTQLPPPGRPTQTMPKRVISGIVAASQQQQAESNKENEPDRRPAQSERPRRRMIDEQSDAESVSWDSNDGLGPLHDVTEQQNRSRAQPSSSRPTERRKRPSPEPNEGRPSPKRARPQPSPLRTQNRTRPSANLRESPESPPRTQAHVHQRANAAAKERTAMQKPKGVQVRKIWTEDENERLIELIEEYGTSYAQLKSIDSNDDNVLARRDQIALKDRAQNMKMDYLKYDSLPRTRLNY